MKNIYIKLPQDIQCIIKSYINYDKNTKKYYKTLNNIINNKIQWCYLKNTGIINISDIHQCYYLSNKYCKIMNINDLNYLYNTAQMLENFLMYLLPDDYGLYNFAILHAFNFNLYNIINYKNSTYDEIFTCISVIRKFYYTYFRLNKYYKSIISI